MSRTLSGESHETVRSVARELRDRWEPELQEFPHILWKAAHLVATYGLNPFAGHLTLKRDRDRNPEDVWVTTAGMIAYANGRDDHEAVQLRPPTEPELRMIRPDEGEYVWAAEVWRKGAAHPVGPEFGRAHASNVSKMVARGGSKNIDAMARTRAIGRALRLAYPIGTLDLSDGILPGDGPDADPDSDEERAAAPDIRGELVPREQLARGPRVDEAGALSSRTIMALRAAGYELLASVPRTRTKLIEVNGIGNKSATEVLGVLQAHGLVDAVDEPEPQPEPDPQPEPATATSAAQPQYPIVDDYDEEVVL